MKYYLHRISHGIELSHPLLERGILSIGWSDFALREFVSSHRARRWEEVPRTIASDPDYGTTRSRFGLRRFLQMNVGDRVVVPSWGTFHVYEVVSDERLIAADLDLCGLKTWDGQGVRREEGQLYEDKDGQRQRHIDLGFFRQVRQIAKDIPRSGYADNALSARLKVRQTNVEINDIRKNVDEAIAGWNKQTPINMAGLVKERCADEVLKLIREKLDPDRLEELINGTSSESERRQSFQPRTRAARKAMRTSRRLSSRSERSSTFRRNTTSEPRMTGRSSRSTAM